MIVRRQFVLLSLIFLADVRKWISLPFMSVWMMGSFIFTIYIIVAFHALFTWIDMACFNPSHAVVVPDEYRSDLEGKLVQKVVFITKERYQEMLAAPSFWSTTGEVLHPIKLPCGKCIGCQLSWSQQWAARMTCESFDYHQEQCWFLTLTYDNDNLPYGLIWHHGDNDQCLVEAPSTRKQDISDFMDAVRMEWYNKYREFGIRFFGATEYGENTFRPHAHLIVYNLDLRDCDYVGKSFCGDSYYRSPTLEKLWGKGFIAVAPFDYKTAAYTARYCVKKSGKRFLPRHLETCEAERAVMSRRPGIAAEFAKQNFKKIYTERDQLTYDHFDLEGVSDYVQLQNGIRVPPPRYFDKLYKQVGSNEAVNLAIIKTAREDKSRRSLLRQLGATNYTEEQILMLAESKAKNALSKLARDLDDELVKNL